MTYFSPLFGTFCTSSARSSAHRGYISKLRGFLVPYGQIAHLVFTSFVWGVSLSKLQGESLFCGRKWEFITKCTSGHPRPPSWLGDPKTLFAASYYNGKWLIVEAGESQRLCYQHYIHSARFRKGVPKRSKKDIRRGRIRSWTAINGSRGKSFIFEWEVYSHFSKASSPNARENVTWQRHRS